MRLIKSNLQIAIDGPVAAGKSILAYRLAKKLKILFVYTGAMYRAVARLGLKNGLDLTKEAPLYKIISKAEIKLTQPTLKKRLCNVLVNGKDITDEIFSSRIHWGSSQVAIFPKIRAYLVKLQQKIAKKESVIMEGRDIGTVVLPNADLKIFMTSDLEVRAKRRLKDLLKIGEKVTLEEVIKEIKKRDYQDSHRKAAPLKVLPESWRLDSTNLTINQEIKAVINRLKELGLVE